MRIHGISRAYAEREQTNTDISMDSEGKEVQNQINNARNRLKELSANQELDDEEKEKKRQEIQQKLTELNQQLRQRQMELLREQQEKRKEALHTSDEEDIEKDSGRREEKLQNAGISQGGMKAMTSADASVRSAQAHGSMAAAFEGRVRVLQGEIRQDEERGRDTSQKQKELKKLEERAERMKGANAYFLTDASKELKQASKRELQAGTKTRKNSADGSVKQIKPPFGQSLKAKTNGYIKGTMYSNVDFHF